MNNDCITYLKKFGDTGINEHENTSYRLGYFENPLNNFLPLKKAIFEKLEKTKDDETKIYLNAIRIYSYSIYENLWYGFVISNSDFDTIKFKIKNEIIELGQNNLYKNHLPSFTSAILLFGTCRDYFCVLLKIIAKKNSSDLKESDLKEIVKVRYTAHNKNENNFENDVKSLTSDEEYLDLAKSILENNSLRNNYAHRLRIIWWHNQNYNEYCFKKELIDSINNGAKNKIWINHFLDIFKDAEKYENEIKSATKQDVICASEILKQYHDEMADFINKTFGHIKNKL